MIVQKLLNCLWAKVAAKLCLRIEKNVCAEIPQFVPEPMIQGHAKAHLPSPAYRWRQQVGKGFQQYALAVAVMELFAKRHAGRQLYDAMIPRNCRYSGAEGHDAVSTFVIKSQGR